MTPFPTLLGCAAACSIGFSRNRKQAGLLLGLSTTNHAENIITAQIDRLNATTRVHLSINPLVQSPQASVTSARQPLSIFCIIDAMLLSCIVHRMLSQTPLPLHVVIRETQRWQYSFCHPPNASTWPNSNTRLLDRSMNPDRPSSV